MPKAKKNLNLPEENPATKRYTHTFSVPPAICLSEPYNDKDSLKRPAHKGKQFQLGKYHGKDAFTTVASEAFEPGVGYLPSSLFQMMPSLTSAVDMKGKAPFQEVERYKDKFKGGEFRPKGATRLGFMSGDYPKRDEYSNVVSTERLRETIRKEDTLSKKQKHARDGEEGFEDEGMLPEIDARRRSTLGGVGGQTLFDVVHRVPDVSLKYKRDDRQGRFFYMYERSKEAGEPVADHALVDLKGVRHLRWLDVKNTERERDGKQGGPAWVQAQLPNGVRLNVLVDRSSQQILEQRSMEERY